MLTMAGLDRRAFLTFAAGAAATPWPLIARAGTTPALIPTRQGLVQGRAENGIHIFTGIPYGQAQRFARALPAPRWSGTRDATLPAHVAPQAGDVSRFAGPVSEDCLQLNIWAPQAPGPHPVLFYIHGGANETGWSGDAGTAGDRFAAHGVVCVTANYRLGALGFLQLGDALGPRYAASANNGMLDLILALEWVRDNIAGFGGDPRRITIAGESAGGKNVGSLMGMPLADSLYQQAALFSGGGETVHDRAAASDVSRLFLGQFKTADAILTAPVDELLAAQGETKTNWPRNYPFRPTVDGMTLPHRPIDRMRMGEAPKIPTLIGSNADESRLFLSQEQASGPILDRYLANESLSRMETLDKAYADAFPALSPAERHWRLISAEEYGMPCLRIALAQAAQGAPTYRYRFAYPAPAGPFKGSTPHAMDLPFTFDHVTQPGFSAFFGLSAADQPLADQMHAAMVAFATTGQPKGTTLPEWRRFDQRRRDTMVWDQAPRCVADPDRVERQIWSL